MLWKLLKNKTLLLLIALLIVPLLLSGCQTQRTSVCPPLVAYTPAFQKEAAKEIANLPAAPHVDVLLQDYAMTRDQLRVCQ